MPLLLVHRRRARRVGLVAAAVVTLVGFVALLASPARAADAPQETIMGGGADAPARAALPPPPPSSPPGPALREDIASDSGASPRAVDAAAERADEERSSRWYGWQTLLTDGAATFLLLAPSQRAGSGSTMAAASVLTYGLGGPIVHLAHKRPGAALGSLGARAAFPAAGFALGVAVEGGRCRELCLMPFVFGVLGIAGAIGLDAGALAYEPAPPRQRPALDASLVQRLTPSVAPRREGGVDLALGGAF